jgi:hypothetical protein
MYDAYTYMLYYIHTCRVTHIYVYVLCSSEGGVTHTKDVSILLKLLPMAMFFMLCVIGASLVRLQLGGRRERESVWGVWGWVWVWLWGVGCGWGWGCRCVFVCVCVCVCLRARACIGLIR